MSAVAAVKVLSECKCSRRHNQSNSPRLVVTKITSNCLEVKARMNSVSQSKPHLCRTTATLEHKITKSKERKELENDRDKLVISGLY